MDHGLGLIVNNITGCGKTATVGEGVKANSRAVDDAIEHSLPRFKHRSLRPFKVDSQFIIN